MVAASAKRAAPTTSQQERSKVARRVRGRVAEAEAAEAGPEAGGDSLGAAAVESAFVQESLPIATLLDCAYDLSEATRDMLKAAAPFGLRTPKADRHEFQHQLTSSLAAIFQSVEASCREATKAAAERCNAVEAERGVLAAAVVTSKENLTACTAHRDKSSTELKEASAGLAAAREALAQSQKRREALEAEHATVGAERTGFERFLAESWAPLRDAGLDGKQWQKRNKKIEQVLAEMERVGLEECLKNCLPIVLKAKSDERGSFAKKAIRFVEEALQQRLVALDERLGGFDAEVAERAAAVAEAQQTLTAAQALEEETTAALVEAENKIYEAKQGLADSELAVKNFNPVSNRSEKARSQAQAELDRISALISRFEELAEAGAECTAKVAEKHVGAEIGMESDAAEEQAAAKVAA